MAPARKICKVRAYTQIPTPECVFWELPIELRTDWYSSLLDPIVVEWHDPLPMNPPLLGTCKRIRTEASSVYGKNHLKIVSKNLNITKATNWMGRQGEKGPPGGHPWQNMLTWVELYYHQRCRRLVDLPAEDSDPKEGDPEDSDDEEPKVIGLERKPCYQVELAVKIFDMLDKLLEKDNKITLAKIRKAVSKHQHDMSRVRA
ncbi:hypothetical protein MBLNU13_g01783t1 [Cladosporium sp. NU13]